MRFASLILIALLTIATPVSVVMAQESLNETQVMPLPFGGVTETTSEIPSIYEDNANAEMGADTITTEPVGEEEKAGLPQFDPTTFTSQIFWLIVAFTILYFYFGRKTLPALSSIIESRRSTVQNDLRAAEKLSADVDNLRNDYENAMAQARMDARQAAQDVENAAREKAEEQNNAFKQRSMASVNAVEAKAKTEKMRIQNELAAIASDLVKDIATAFAGMNLNDKDVKQAVEKQLNDTNTTTLSKQKAA